MGRAHIPPAELVDKKLNILYLPCHSILEYDEVKLFLEMGHNVFSFGSYVNPLSPHDNKRPPIEIGRYDEYLTTLATRFSKDKLPPEMIEPFDVIICMHVPEWIKNNWEAMKHKVVVWRTIGQSVAGVENELNEYRQQGMKIVRYSPAEERIPGYIGSDAVIRFYKDESEYGGWVGNIPAVLNVTQSMKQRGAFCGYDIFNQATEKYQRNLYGSPSRNPDNSLMDDPLWRGQLSNEELIQAYRNHRVYFYTGTYPASYTLNFIEALMTGIPVVAIGNALANLNFYSGMDAYEVSNIIENGVNGFCSDSVKQLEEYIGNLLSDDGLAKSISEAGRNTAIQLFGKETIKKQWEDFFNSL